MPHAAALAIVGAWNACRGFGVYISDRHLEKQNHF
jgi:hypothetical protein